MQKNRVKSVFVMHQGRLIGSFPLMTKEDTLCVMRMQMAFLESHAKSIRMVVGNQVFEMHTDKYNNVIFRSYEKT